MNQRTAEMVQLLNRERGEHDIAGLAQYFQVSQRTIRNDLKEINTTLQQNGFDGISLQSGGKLKLPDTFEKALPFLIAGDFYSYKLPKEERKRVAAAMIVNSTEYITLAAIAENLFVSRATIINDLKDIKAFVQEGKLEVLSHANKGLRVAGAESDKRAFLLKLLRPSEFENEQSAISRHVSVQAGDRVIIQKILSEQEHRYKRFLDDSSFREILLYLSVMVERNLAGEFLEPQPESNSDKYLLAQDTLRYISQYCNVITTEDDIRYLSRMLENVRYMRHSVFGKDTVKIQMITRQFIASISVELGMNLNTDYDFFENLSNHLESVFSAPPISYPKLDVIEEILEDSQDVVEAVRNQLPALCQYMGRMLNEMEIHYIAVHVCAAIERKKNKEVAVHKGNLFRTLISGSCIMAMTIWITNQAVGWTTILGQSVGALEDGATLAAMDQGGCPITYIFTQIFTRESIPGLIVIGGIYVVCMVFAVMHSKKRAAELAAADAE